MPVAHCIACQVADKEHWDLVELSLSPGGKYQIDFCMRDHGKLSRHSDNGTYQLVPFGYLSHLQVTLLALYAPCTDCAALYATWTGCAALYTAVHHSCATRTGCAALYTLGTGCNAVFPETGNGAVVPVLPPSAPQRPLALVS